MEASNNSEGEWQQLFSALESHEAKQTQQKQQGLNDFNVLSSVLSVNDEVRLHTRFIFALLNPDSKHYMGSRFLELFLQCLGREDWLDPSSAIVRKEFCPVGQSEQIDLFITDGNRQIVIENKLNAQDQPQQLQRYLRAVGAADPDSQIETLFIYLTKGRKVPSPHSLNSFCLSSDMQYILDRNGARVAQYQALSYSRRSQTPCIHDWLDACLLAAEDRPNIAWAIQDYRATVERATREYVSKVTSLKDLLEEGIHQEKTYHEQAIQLSQALPSIHASWLEQALTLEVDALLEPLIRTGVITKIGAESSSMLRPFVSEHKQSSVGNIFYQNKYNFFHPGQGTRNRGVFYRVETGSQAQQVVLMLFYGKSMLHVGCLLNNEARDKASTLLFDMNLSKPKALSANLFPGALTYAEPLETKGIVNLANFKNSPQRAILLRLCDALACSEFLAVGK